MTIIYVRKTNPRLASLVTLALRSNQALSLIIRVQRSRDREARDILRELEDLEKVLTELQSDGGFAATSKNKALEKLLERCNKACHEFKELIMECNLCSVPQLRDERAWLKLRFMGDDIIGFKNMMANYKSTIRISQVTLDKETPTIEDLNAYREDVLNTKCDLEVRLQEVISRLQSSLTGFERNNEINNRLREERDCVVQCLEICDSFAAEIERKEDSLVTTEPLLPLESLRLEASEPDLS